MKERGSCISPSHRLRTQAQTYSSMFGTKNKSGLLSFRNVQCWLLLDALSAAVGSVSVLRKLFSGSGVWFKPSISVGKKGDLSDFERGMIVGARRAGLSISETANLLGFSRTTISRVYREWSEKEKTSSERQFCGRKCLVDARGQRRMARLVRADRRATVTQITTRYNQGGQKSISERTVRRTLRQMGYSSRRPHRVPVLSAKNRKLRLQFAQAHRNWTIEDWKNVAWSDESRFLLRHSEGRVRIWRLQHESMDPSCLVSTVQAGGGGGVMVWGIFSRHSLGPLVPIEHRCNATAYLSIVADHRHSHKGIISDWFLEHDNEFAVLKWPPQSPDLNPIEHIWDVVEREIRTMDVDDKSAATLLQSSAHRVWETTKREARPGVQQGLKMIQYLTSNYQHCFLCTATPSRCPGPLGHSILSSWKTKTSPGYLIV
ncbi:hypothetical protein F2P79_006926 [Pimephales promelas]|nr:hypothetical protein F2P79_006926 [Pimephales promelas]